MNLRIEEQGNKGRRKTRGIEEIKAKENLNVTSVDENRRMEEKNQKRRERDTKGKNEPEHNTISTCNQKADNTDDTRLSTLFLKAASYFRHSYHLNLLHNCFCVDGEVAQVGERLLGACDCGCLASRLIKS